MMINISRHISVSINRPADEVYEFVSHVKNLPKWAAGLKDFTGKVAFAEKNKFGVLDQNVTLPSGKTVFNPMRVFPNSEGCEVVFTLYKQPEMTDEMFRADAQLVQKDLNTLKTLLER